MKKWSSKILILVLLFSLTNCAFYKKIVKKESKETENSSIETRATDSVVVVLKTLPTKTTWTFEAVDLYNAKDFSQVIYAGKGNETSIIKKDGKITMSTSTAESTDSNSKIKNTAAKDTKQSEKTVKETTNKTKTIPWWFWLIIVIAVLFALRKQVVILLMYLYPKLAAVLAAKEIFSKRKEK